jgi:hypothetical protein
VGQVIGTEGGIGRTYGDGSVFLALDFKKDAHTKARRHEEGNGNCFTTETRSEDLGRSMTLLTELNNVLVPGFYNDIAPMELPEQLTEGARVKEVGRLRTPSLSPRGFLAERDGG